MDLTRSILEDVRIGVGLGKDTVDFDTELLMHINAAIGVLNQNGVGNFLVVQDSTKTWGDLQDVTQIEGNKYFQIVPLFVTMSTKVIFDPPPPSAVEYHSKNIEQMIWRLQVAYEEPIVVVTKVVE